MQKFSTLKFPIHQSPVLTENPLIMEGAEIYDKNELYELVIKADEVLERIEKDSNLTYFEKYEIVTELKYSFEKFLKDNTDFARRCGHDLIDPLQGLQGMLFLKSIGNKNIDDFLSGSLEISQCAIGRLIYSLNKEEALNQRKEIEVGGLLGKSIYSVLDSEFKIFIESESSEIMFKKIFVNAKIIGNLIVNVLKNLKHADVRASKVSLKIIEGEKGTVQLHIMDDGKGVRKSMKDKIFETGESGNGSTGIGLGDEQKTMEDLGCSLTSIPHGGLPTHESLLFEVEIDVEEYGNQPRNGACFVLEFPLVEAINEGGERINSLINNIVS